MKFPDDLTFYRNLLLQRTNILFDTGGASAFRRWAESGDASQIDAGFFDEDVRRRVVMQAEAEYDREASQLIDFVAGRALRDLVSIGPGNAILETILVSRLSTLQTVSLIDIENTGSHHHGYAEKGAGYASLSASRDFMINNGVSPSVVRVCNPVTQALPTDSFDFLISILSMGFHYPCDSYVEYIVAKCRIGGIVVIDLRRGVDDVGFSKILGSGFNVINCVQFGKFQRVVLDRTLR